MYKSRRIEMRPRPVELLRFPAPLELLWEYRCAQGTSAALQLRLRRRPASLFLRRAPRAGQQPQEERWCSASFSYCFEHNTREGGVKASASPARRESAEGDDSETMKRLPYPACAVPRPRKNQTGK